MEDRRTTKRRATDRSAVGWTASEALITQTIHDARQQAAGLRALIQAMDDNGYVLTPDTFRYLSDAASELSALLEHILDQSRSIRRIGVWRSIEDIAISARLTGQVELDLITDEEATIVADPALLRRATRNLLDNAVRAAGRGGRVRVTVQRQADSTSVIIEDSGPGFGGVPGGRASIGLGVVAEFLGSVHGSFEILRSDLGGARLRVNVPDRVTGLDLDEEAVGEDIAM
jgi:signal transduction histidine kinase